MQVNRSKFVSKKGSPKFRSRRLPPHSWEAHPLAHKGEANKAFVVVVVTIVAVLALVLLVFFSQQFVGKAVEPTFYMPVGYAGINLSQNLGMVNSSFTLPIRVNTGIQKTVNLSFNLSYDPALQVNCNALLSEMDTLFGSYKSYSNYACGNGKIYFEYVWVCNSSYCLNGLFGFNKYIANVSFTATSPGSYNFNFTSFKVYTLTGSLIPLTILNTTVAVTNSGCYPDCNQNQICQEEFLSKKCVDILVCDKIGQQNCTHNSTDGNIVCFDGSCVAPECAMASQQLISQDNQPAPCNSTLPCVDPNQQCSFILPGIDMGFCFDKTKLSTLFNSCVGAPDFCQPKLSWTGDKCGVGEGDCTNDSFCQEGLICAGSNPLFDSSIKTCISTGCVNETWYRDLDNDGNGGVASLPEVFCTNGSKPGYSKTSNDCFDTNKTKVCDPGTKCTSQGESCEEVCDGCLIGSKRCGGNFLETCKEEYAYCTRWDPIFCGQGMQCSASSGEPKCVSDLYCSSNKDCLNKGGLCQNGICAKLATAGENITISMINPGGLTLQDIANGIVHGSDYLVQIQIVPTVDLPAHYVKVSLVYDNSNWSPKNETIQEYWSLQPSIIAKNLEVITFNHKVLNKPGNMKIKVQVFSQWSPLPEFNLMPSMESVYEIY
jgi:hypothetical protein